MTGGDVDGPTAVDAPEWDAEGLASRLKDRAGDLVATIEVVDPHLVRAVGIPDLLEEALDALHDVVGLPEMLAITVVDRTDLGEGLELVHHLAPTEGGVTLELWTPLTVEGGALAPPSATKHWRSAAWLEREAWELSGVPFRGHDDLRRLLLPRWGVGHPLRRDGARQRTQVLEPTTVTPGDAAPEGDDWRLAELPRASMGGRLDLRVRIGEGRVTKARLGVGHLHRGVEGLAEGRSWEGVMPIVARTAARSSLHWQTAYAEAVERLAGMEVPPRGRAIRLVLLELERIADHMLALATVHELLGCPAAASRVWADRELVLDGSQMLTGQRLVQDAVVVGGVARDAPEGWARRLHLLSRTVQAAVREYVAEAEALTPLGRLEGLARVHLPDMRGWGLSGPLIRSAGVARDARSDGRCATYEDQRVAVQVREAGDAMARVELWLLEMTASALAIARTVRSLPGGRVRAPAPGVFPKGRGIGVAEAPGGEVLCHVVSDGTDRPRRVRLRGPDLPHVAALEDLLLGCPVDDVALAVASVDISVGGCDR